MEWSQWTSREEAPDHVLRHCKTHGMVQFRKMKVGTFHRCQKCINLGQDNDKRKKRARLVTEAGGTCSHCGYSEFIQALHFHHIDPTQKLFSLRSSSLSKSWITLKEEAAKCALLCASCHLGYEHGLVEIPSLQPALRPSVPQTLPTIKCVMRRNLLLNTFGSSCMRCGWDEIMELLQFHHVIPETKVFMVDRAAMKHRWLRILEEVAKCSILCPNCHSGVTARMIKWDRPVTIDPGLVLVDPVIDFVKNLQAVSR